MKKSITAAILLLITAVWLLYAQTGGFEFLRLDDHDYTFRCLFVKDGLSWSNVAEAFTNARHAAIWMPVTYITYMADISLFGPGMGPHHLVNVAVHALNAVLFFLLLLLLFRRCVKSSGGTAAVVAPADTPCGNIYSDRAAGLPDDFSSADSDKSCDGMAVWIAFLCAAFWALHPQRTEAVAWIAGRKELLCAFFILLGLLFWVCRRRENKAAGCNDFEGVKADSNTDFSDSFGSWKYYAGSVVCCVLACMSKPTGMCFPFLAFATDVLLGKLPAVTRRSPAPVTNHRSPITNYSIAYLPMLLTSVAVGALAVYSQTHPEGRGELSLFTASFAWRILNAVVSVGLYVFHMIVPVGIHLDYGAMPEKFPVDGVIGLAASAGVIVSVGLLAWRVRRSRRMILAMSIFFFAAIVPTLGVFGSFGEHARADRFFYLPATVFPLGLLWLFAVKKNGDSPRVFSAECRVQNAERDGDSPRQNVDGDGNLTGGLGGNLFPPSVRAMPRKKTSWLLFAAGCLVMFVYAGVACVVTSSYKNDHTAFSRTLQFEPENGRALAHVAAEECARFGRIDKGVTLYRKSQEVRPRDDTAAQLAYSLALRGLSSDYSEIRRLCAKFACDHSLDRKGMALEALGATAMRQRKWSEAISCLEDSVAAPLRFYSADDAKLRLGACYANARQTEDAIRVLEPLTQSSRADISSRARQFLQTLKKNPNSLFLW